MIRRDVNNSWILISQNDHAHLSYEIMKNWGNDQFEQIFPADEVLTAIREHDCGWKEWDKRPVLNKENEYPKNFMEMDVKDQYVIWKNSFENLSENHNYASALVALHFSKFNNKSLTRNPDNRTAKILKNEINEFVSEKLNIKNNKKKSNGFLPMDVRINLRFLQIGDIISLALCHGWNSTVIENVPINYRNDSINLNISSEDGYNYSVSPNPFSENDLNFDIVGKKLPSRKFRSQEDLDKDFDKAREQILRFSITGKEL